MTTVNDPRGAKSVDVSPRRIALIAGLGLDVVESVRTETPLANP
jgi:hypothetical protein